MARVQRKDLYHGAGLTQILEHGSFKALNKATPKRGHYLVNQHVRFLLKYSTGSGEEHGFTFRPDDLEVMVNDIEGNGIKAFLVLVCGDETVCCPDEKEISKVLDVRSGDGRQHWIRVLSPEGKSMRVNGSNGELGWTVAHSRFPGCIFGD